MPPGGGGEATGVDAKTEGGGHSGRVPSRLMHPAYWLTIGFTVLAVGFAVASGKDKWESAPFVIDTVAAFVGAAEVSYGSKGGFWKFRTPTTSDQIAGSAFLAGVIAAIWHYSL